MRAGATAAGIWLAVCAGVLPGQGAMAGGLPPSTVPGSPPGYNFPLATDSVTADPKNHHVIYEDTHVRILEVTLWPFDREVMHGHAYPSVFVNDDVSPKMINTAPYDHGEPPFGTRFSRPGAPAYPGCITLGPQSPHAATIVDHFPQHFYRMEFKRLDPAGFAAHWRQTYPELASRHGGAAAAATGPGFSADWNHPIGYETVRASPDNYRQLFDNGHVRIIEVTILPGASERLNGSPYYAVQAFDTAQPGEAGGARIEDRPLDPGSPMINKAVLGGAGPPVGLDGPTCTVSGPLPLHRVTNVGSVPVHYYRFEFLRVDGADFARQWTIWYPEMMEGPKPPALR